MLKKTPSPTKPCIVTSKYNHIPVNSITPLIDQPATSSSKKHTGNVNENESSNEKKLQQSNNEDIDDKGTDIPIPPWIILVTVDRINDKEQVQVKTELVTVSHFNQSIGSFDQI